MRLWLDDIREAPEGWHWAKDYEEAVAAMETGTVTEASLDHDLGDRVSVPERNGYRLTLWMAEHDCWPSKSVRVHSHNPVGATGMVAVVNRYGNYEEPCRWVPYE